MTKKNECPYYLLEEVTDIPVPHDVVIDGKKYWESCNIDRIAMDAADLIERGL